MRKQQCCGCANNELRIEIDKLRTDFNDLHLVYKHELKELYKIGHELQENSKDITEESRLLFKTYRQELKDLLKVMASYKETKSE